MEELAADRPRGTDARAVARHCQAECIREAQVHWFRFRDMANLAVAWISELRPTPPSFEDILGSVPPLPIRPESRIPTAEPPFPPPLDPVLPQTPILNRMLCHCSSSRAETDCAIIYPLTTQLAGHPVKIYVDTDISL